MRLRRCIDVFGVLVCLAIVSPLIPFVCLAIYLTDRGPVFYLQKRAGLHGRPFHVLKFRSMRNNELPTNHGAEIRANHPEVTPVGALIRRLKIDELPQILNVLKGQMSLIGPRPTLVEQVEAYSDFQLRRLEIAPGLTGWAQVNGGIEISWPERIMLDVWYIDHRSWRLDLIIFFRTFAVIVLGESPNRRYVEAAITYAQSRPENAHAVASMR